MLSLWLTCFIFIQALDPLEVAPRGCQVDCPMRFLPAVLSLEMTLMRPHEPWVCLSDSRGCRGALAVLLKKLFLLVIHFKFFKLFILY